MTNPLQPPPLPSSPASSGTLAMVSLGLGITSLLFGLFIVGGLAGIVGLILGILHLKQKTTHRTPAKWGIGLSAIGTTLSISVLVIFWFWIRPLFNDYEPAECFEASEWIGKPLPDLALTTLDGKVIRTTDLKGHPVALDMWASWHPACVAAVTDFNRLADETASQGVHIIAISFEPQSDVAAFTTNRTLNFPIVVTNDLPAPFGKVDSVPTTFFINADGIIREIRVGYDSYEALKQSVFSQILAVPSLSEEESP